MLALLDKPRRIKESHRRRRRGASRVWFPGQYYDVETGLNFNNNRNYDATTGRYAQSDPIGLAGGPSTYAYVGGDPLSRIDPMGLTWGDDWTMFWQWVGGTAPPNTVYGPGTNQSNDMMQSQGVQDAIAYFNKKYAGKCADQWGSVTNYDYKFGLPQLIDAGTNSTQQFVGSYSVNIYPGGNGTLSVHVYNTTSMTSFLYGVYPNSWNPSNGHPFGNTSQEYIGNVPDAMNACGCSQ